MKEEFQKLLDKTYRLGTQEIFSDVQQVAIAVSRHSFNHYSFKFLPLHNPLGQAMLRVNPGKLRSNLRKAYTKDRGKHNPTNPKAVCISQNEFSTGNGTTGRKSIRKCACGMLQVPAGFEVLAVKRNENKNSWQDSQRKRLKKIAKDSLNTI